MGWKKISDALKPYEKKYFNENTLKYPRRDKGTANPTKFH